MNPDSLLVAFICTAIASIPMLIYVYYSKEEDGYELGFIGYFIIQNLRSFNGR